MAEHKFDSDNKNTALAEYITVAIAEDMELAEEYRGVLNNSDIQAVLRTQRGGNSEILGVAVMVPEQSSELAITIIESQQAFDDFLNVAFNSNDGEDDDDDYFDDFKREADDFLDDDF